LNQRYQQAIDVLSAGKDHTMTVTGNSMVPLIYSKSKLMFRATDDYQVGDVVMARVSGRMIDAHKITKVDASGRFMIANNRGHENGWASQIFGRVIAVNGLQFGRPANQG
jgi:SOS-response transcriptional repressor LexA